jgi:hypothetical protein
VKEACGANVNHDAMKPTHSVNYYLLFSSFINKAARMARLMNEAEDINSQIAFRLTRKHCAVAAKMCFRDWKWKLGIC